MNQAQLESLIAMYTATQIAIIHLVNVLESQGVGNRAAIAASLAATADGLPADVQQRDVIVQSLHQLAAGIRGAMTPDEHAAQMRSLMR